MDSQPRTVTIYTKWLTDEDEDGRFGSIAMCFDEPSVGAAVAMSVPEPLQPMQHSTVGYWAVLMALDRALGVFKRDVQAQDVIKIVTDDSNVVTTLNSCKTKELREIENNHEILVWRIFQQLEGSLKDSVQFALVGSERPIGWRVAADVADQRLTMDLDARKSTFSNTEQGIKKLIRHLMAEGGDDDKK